MPTIADNALLLRCNGSIMTGDNELSTDIHQMDYNSSNVFLILFDEQAFCALCGWAGCWNRVDQNAKPLWYDPTAVFFNPAGTLVMPLSSSVGPDCGHAHRGGGWRLGRRGPPGR